MAKKKKPTRPPGKWVSVRTRTEDLWKNHSPECAGGQAQQQHSLRVMTGFWLAIFIEGRMVLDRARACQILDRRHNLSTRHKKLDAMTEADESFLCIPRNCPGSNQVMLKFLGRYSLRVLSGLGAVFALVALVIGLRTGTKRADSCGDRLDRRTAEEESFTRETSFNSLRLSLPGSI